MGRDYEQERVKPFCHEHTERVSWDEWVYEKRKSDEGNDWQRGMNGEEVD